MDIKEAHISMSVEEAHIAFQEYRDALKEKWNAEDEALKIGYKELSKGHQILDLVNVFKKTRLDHKGRPELAIVRADSKQVWFRSCTDGRGYFSMERYYRPRATMSYIALPEGTFSPARWVRGVTSVVPFIPPRFRPTTSLSNYHILWEADWTAPPRDPILLKRIKGTIFAVVAQWDLTELERLVLGLRS